MPASADLERLEVAFVDFVGSVAAGYGAVSEAVYVEDSKGRVLAATSLKTYTQTTLAPTNNKLVGYEWMVILALPPALLLSSVVGAEAVVTAVATMQSPASRSWFGMYVPPPESYLAATYW